MIKAQTSHQFIIIFKKINKVYPLLDFLEFSPLLPALVLVELLACHSVYP